jgi:hypothetical protein
MSAVSVVTQWRPRYREMAVGGTRVLVALAEDVRARWPSTERAKGTAIRVETRLRSERYNTTVHLEFFDQGLPFFGGEEDVMGIGVRLPDDADAVPAHTRLLPFVVVAKVDGRAAGEATLTAVRAELKAAGVGSGKYESICPRGSNWWLVYDVGLSAAYAVNSPLRLGHPNGGGGRPTPNMRFVRPQDEGSWCAWLTTTESITAGRGLWWRYGVGSDHNAVILAIATKRCAPDADQAIGAAKRARRAPVVLIGISGCSRSGKSTLAARLKSELASLEVVVIAQDDFFLAPEAIADGDWDAPGAIDHEAFALAVRAAVGDPDVDVVLAEGFQAFHLPCLTAEMALRFWITLSESSALARRRSTYGNRRRYFEQRVWPNHLEYRSRALGHAAGAELVCLDGEASSAQLFDEAKAHVRRLLL